MYIAVAGNIGSGKSTLTHLLARHYGWEACYESVDNNPYLEDYYRDIHRWSFNLEIYFLKERFRNLLAIRQADHTIIQDRTIYEGVHVFMANNKAMGNLSARTMLGNITVYTTTVFRLFLIPIGLYFLCSALGFDPYVVNINTMVIAMPVATYGTILCLKYNRDTTLITEVTLITTLLSMLTIPLLTVLFTI